MIWREIPPPISKGCPFAFSTVDRLDFFFFFKASQSSVFNHIMAFPRAASLWLQGSGFFTKKKKKRAMPFNFCPQFVQFMVCCRGQIPVSLLDSTLPSSALTLKDNIWSWDLIFSIKLRPWYPLYTKRHQSHLLISLCSPFCTFHTKELSLWNVPPAALSRGIMALHSLLLVQNHAY